MGRSSLFLAVTIILAGLLLSLFALSILPKRKSSNDRTGGAAALTPLAEPKVDFANPSLGPNDAPVTIVEFGDFLCAPCAEVQADIEKVVAAHSKDVKFVWKDLPNVNAHPQAAAASIAARCAGLQGEFWPYHDLLLKNRASVNPAAYRIFAEELKLDATELQACVDEQRTSALIERDMEEALRLGLDATPTFFINGRRVTGILSFDQFETFIAAAKAAPAPAPAP